jgi:hypothetical protein
MTGTSSGHGLIPASHETEHPNSARNPCHSAVLLRQFGYTQDNDSSLFLYSSLPQHPALSHQVEGKVKE